MKKETTILTNKSLNINKDLTKKYFSKNGFILKYESDDCMIYKRGSLFQNFVTFNPLKWKSEIKITYNDSTIYLTININTIGQIPTLKEELLWDAFISNFEVTVLTEKDMTQNNKQALQNTKSHSFRLVGWALIGAIAFGIPAGMIAYYTNIDILTAIGAGIGAIIVMTYKNNKEKQSKFN